MDDGGGDAFRGHAPQIALMNILNIYPPVNGFGVAAALSFRRFVFAGVSLETMSKLQPCMSDQRRGYRRCDAAAYGSPTPGVLRLRSADALPRAVSAWAATSSSTASRGINGARRSTAAGPIRVRSRRGRNIAPSTGRDAARGCFTAADHQPLGQPSRGAVFGDIRTTSSRPGRPARAQAEDPAVVNLLIAEDGP